MSYPLLEIPLPAQLVTQTPVCYLKYSLHVTSSGSPSILSFFHFYLIIMLIAIALCFRVSHKCVHHCTVIHGGKYCVLLTVPLWSEHDLVFFLAALLRHVGSVFPTKDQNHAPALEALSLNHWSTRVPKRLSHLSEFCLCCRRLEPVDFVSQTPTISGSCQVQSMRGTKGKCPLLS